MPATSPVDTEPGLRERKRRATRLAIQRAAIEVVRERGLDGATVDEISRTADVSPRTFFNYFASKEDAILGESPSLDGVAEAEAFVADRGPLLAGLARVVTAASAPLLTADHELVHERRALGKLFPEIAIRRMANVHRFEAELTDLAARRVAAEHPGLGEDEVADRARLVALVGFALVRHAWFGWVEHPDADHPLTELVDRSFELGAQLLAAS